MTETARILVVAADSADARMIARFISEDFEDVQTATDQERMVDEFEAYEPQVLVLAFRTLEESERYYLGLYRLGTRIHAIPHRTVILCNRESLARVASLCRKEYFDDYVLFWPSVTDPFRLNMSIYQALRRSSERENGGPSSAEFAVQARRIAELEGTLQSNLKSGGTQIANISQTLKDAEEGVGEALDAFSRLCVDGENRDVLEIRNRNLFEAQLARLKQEEIGVRMSRLAESIRPAEEWMGAFSNSIAPQLHSARKLVAMAAKVRPKVLFIDDDEFQHRLLQRLLGESELDLHCAASATDALKMLRTLRPDLILMDFNLPQSSGVELTRQIKSAPMFSSVPVIMVTGSSAKKVVMDSLNAGASDFVLKPFDKDRLLTRIDKQLGLAAARAASAEQPAQPS